MANHHGPHDAHEERWWSGCGGWIHSCMDRSPAGPTVQGRIVGYHTQVHHVWLYLTLRWLFMIHIRHKMPQCDSLRYVYLQHLPPFRSGDVVLRCLHLLQVKRRKTRFLSKKRRKHLLPAQENTAQENTCLSVDTSAGAQMLASDCSAGVNCLAPSLPLLCPPKGPDAWAFQRLGPVCTS